jgi:hypothetical protein
MQLVVGTVYGLKSGNAMRNIFMEEFLQEHADTKLPYNRKFHKMVRACSDASLIIEAAESRNSALRKGVGIAYYITLTSFVLDDFQLLLSLNAMQALLTFHFCFNFV